MFKSVKSALIPVAVILIAALAVPVQASTVEVTLYGPEQFARDAGSPETAVRDFSVQRLVAQSYALQVQNGSMEGDSLVSSAVISLNGTVVLKQNDFNQNTTSMEEVVILQGTNTLEVELASIPASHITITIVGNYLPEDVDDDNDGYTENEGDCDDTNSAVNPSSAEVCDYIDNNCDGDIDEGVTTLYYLDADSDSYGLASSPIEECSLPEGYSDNADDCDDTNSMINPDTVWYEDIDGDGYTTGVTLTQCQQPAGYVLEASTGDCDDLFFDVNPGATEICNAIDDDCDTFVDEGFDTDGDGYTTCGGDCDDSAGAVNPSAAETCNLIDDDCDGSVDEGVTLIFYPDADGDGYGLSSGSVQACTAPTGYAANSGDCDDLSFDVNPGAAEICDGLDNDCDGTVDPGCLTGITVDPESFTLTGTTSTQQLTVMGYYSDNTSLGLTGSSTGTVYSSSDINVAGVTPEGLVTAVGTGSAVITASNGGFTADASVTVQLLPETYIPQPPKTFGSIYEDLVPPDITIESYDMERFAVITGLVQDRFEGAIAGVTVTVHDHPEYGSVLTDGAGRFSIPVNGAAMLTVQYEKAGLLTIQRQVEVPWNDIGVAPTVTMIQRDSADPTLVMFTGDPADVTVHRSSDTIDQRGTRSATIVFGGDNRAFTYDESGLPAYHSTITVSATEYDTPESMPAVLPPTSAFTYCVELDADGLSDLHFEKPVTVWVDNFIGFDVGEIVPVGYYNMKTAQWEAMENGVVVRLLDTIGSDNVVDALDADGDDQPDDLNGNGSFTDEVQGLEDPARYLPGDTYWRFEVDHFSPFDANWPWNFLGGIFGPLLDLGPYVKDSPCKAGPCNQNTNSYIEQRSRVFNEDIPIPGTGMTLHYASNRVEGGQKQIITVPVTEDTIPEYLLGEVVRIQIAGRVFQSTFDTLPNQEAEFEWDGLDYRGHPVKGPRKAHIKVGWNYAVMYQSAAGIRRAFAFPGSTPTGIVKNGERIKWREWDLDISSDPGGSLAEGWTLSPHHQVVLAAPNTLYKGDGTKLSNSNLIMDIFAGTGGRGVDGIGGPAIDAEIGWPIGVHADKDRNIYIALGDAHTIFKVDNDGIITRFAGGGAPPSGNGDGGLATEASLGYVYDIASDHLGNIYIVDGYVIRKVSPDGIITRYAGGGDPANSWGNGLLATDVEMHPFGIALDAQGNLYYADALYGRPRVCKIDPNGILQTVAGTGIRGYSGDGGPATSARLASPYDVAVDKDGNLYIADSGRVRKVSANGIITTVAGNGENPYQVSFPGEGSIATEVPLDVGGVEVDDSGNLYIIGRRNSVSIMHIIKITPQGLLYTVAGARGAPYLGGGGPAYYAALSSNTRMSMDDAGNIYACGYFQSKVGKISASRTFAGSFEQGYFRFPEESGVGHVITPNGLHERTVDLSTGMDLLNFGYDTGEHLTSITDRFGNATTIQRDGAGVPTSITSPDGIVTGLTIDSNGHLKNVTYPDGTFYTMDYTSDGLMTFETDPAGNTFEHRYDDTGRVTDILDPEGGHWTFGRTLLEDSASLVSIVSAEGDETSYEDRQGVEGEFTSLITGPDGSQSTYQLSSDGLFAEKQTSCGLELDSTYDMDRIHGYQTVKGSSVAMPSGLLVTTSFNKVYADTNNDEVPDLITDTVTVNGKTSAVVNDVLAGTVTATSPTGRQVTSYYSPTTLLTSRTSTPGLLDTDFTYDTRGRLETVAVGTRTTSFAYDGYGYLDYMTTPDGRTFDYTYDIMGRLTGEDRPDGGQVDYSYDDNGNVTAIVNPNTITHDFTYTANDQRESYNTPVSGSYVYQYDRDRRLTSVMYPSGATITNTWATGQLQSTSTPEGLISYGYDCGGKLGSVSKGGESSSYTYDGSLLLTDTRAGTISETISYGYNSDLQVDSIGYAGAYESFVYDGDGLLTDAGAYSITRDAANGLPEAVSDGTTTQSRNFSSYGEVDGVDYTVGASAPYSWSVLRDNAGRITQKVENIGADSVTWDYTYDLMGRLETVYKDSIMAEAYSYDGQGNRLEETNVLRGVSRTYTHDDEDKIVYAGLDIYTYDLDGFLTSRSISSGAYSGAATFDYSSRGELLSATLPTGDTITYAHDPMGRRISKSVNGIVVEKYLWQDATTLLAVYDGSDNLLQRFEYADGRMPVSMTHQGAVYYFAYDQVGSLKVITDAAGTVVKRVDYDSFGNILSDSDPAFSVPFGFAGGLQDRYTGLIRFGARDYDPATGKWTAKDPIDFGGGDLNLLGYTFNNPVDYLDPDGMDAVRITYEGYPVYHDGKYYALGHSAVIAINPETGATAYYEYGRYGGPYGLVRRMPIPNVEMHPDGRPTRESLLKLYDYISDKYGKGMYVIAEYFPFADYQKVIDYAEKIKNRPSRKPYSIPFNTCHTFSHKVIEAGLR